MSEKNEISENSSYTIGGSFELSEGEKVEVLKAKIEEAITSSELSVTSVYYVMKEFSDTLWEKKETFSAVCRERLLMKLELEKRAEKEKRQEYQRIKADSSKGQSQE